MLWGVAGPLALQLLTLMAVLASLRRLRRAVGLLLREFKDRRSVSSP
jgi:hypothetical protein